MSMKKKKESTVGAITYQLKDIPESIDAASKREIFIECNAYPVRIGSGGSVSKHIKIDEGIIADIDRQKISHTLAINALLRYAISDLSTSEKQITLFPNKVERPA